MRYESFQKITKLKTNVNFSNGAQWARISQDLHKPKKKFLGTSYHIQLRGVKINKESEHEKTKKICINKRPLFVFFSCFFTTSSSYIFKRKTT